MCMETSSSLGNGSPSVNVNLFTFKIYIYFSNMNYFSKINIANALISLIIFLHYKVILFDYLRLCFLKLC